MVVQFAERPGDVKRLIADMDLHTRASSDAFCGVDDDQAFGTYSKCLLLPPVGDCYQEWM